MRTTRLTRLLINTIPYQYCLFPMMLQGASKREIDDAYGILTDAARRGLIEKVYLYEPKDKEETQVIPAEEATKHQKRYGIYACKLTGKGLKYLQKKSDLSGETFFDSVIFMSTEFVWGSMAPSSTNTYNQARQRQAIVNIMRAAGVATVTEPRPKPQADEISEYVQPHADTDANDFKGAVARRMEELQLPTNTLKDMLKTTPVLYMRSEFFPQLSVNRDSVVALLCTADEYYPVYHTTNPRGTLWVEKSKHQTKETVISFDYNMGFPVKSCSVTSAFLFVSTVKEFRDVFVTAHELPHDCKRKFGKRGAGSIQRGNIAKPYEHLYVIPESTKAWNQVQDVLKKYDDEFFEDTFAAKLNETYPDALYESLEKFLGRRYDETILRLPEKNSKEWNTFLDSEFKFAAVLDTEDSSKVTPVLFGYDMDAVAISKAFYWFAETDIIGSITLPDGEHRNLIIACYDWQYKFYSHLFTDAIFLNQRKKQL